MQLTSEHRFSASPADVLALLSAEDFLREAAVEMGSRDITASATPGPDGDVATLVRATVDAPEGLRAFLGGGLTVEHRVTWTAPAADGSASGRLALDVVGAPAGVTGIARIEPDGAGTLVSYAGEVEVRVPLLGARLAQQAAPLVTDALDAQERVAVRRLAR